MSKSVLIAGGGIAGLCAAVALRRQGFDVRVFERADEVRPAGAGIGLAANALHVLARLDLADAALARGVPLKKFLITDERAHVLSDALDAQKLTAEFGYGIIGMLRSDLHAVLMSVLDADSIVTGKQLARFESSAQSVKAYFADGSVEQGDILLAADGNRSAARQQIFPQIALRYSGQTSYRGIASIIDAHERYAVAREMWGAHWRFGYLPVARDRVYWYATRLAAAGSGDIDKSKMKRDLLDASREFADPITQIIEATSAEDFIQTDMWDLPPLPRWHQGNVALIGDAAHATTPNLAQGGCQAIEDAYVLADALRQSADDVERAFAHYESLRKAKAEMIVARSRQIGDMVHLSSPLMRVLRNTAMRAIPPSLMSRQNRAIYSLNF
jgi:2-polyprenyl-6-methoxyphenol hydroxylase-like FAD-dependent oxidoreductase